MLFDASNATAGSSARLNSPQAEVPSGKSCLEFYYNLNGVNVNKLVVYTISNGYRNQIFNVSGNQGRAWRIARINLDLSDAFQLQFEAFRGDSIRG